MDENYFLGWSLDITSTCLEHKTRIEKKSHYYIWLSNSSPHPLFVGLNLSPLVEIGLTDLPKSGGAMAPWHLRHTRGWHPCYNLHTLFIFTPINKNESYFLVRLYIASWTFVRQSSCMYCHYSGRHKTVKFFIYCVH